MRSKKKKSNDTVMFLYIIQQHYLQTARCKMPALLYMV